MNSPGRATARRAPVTSAVDSRLTAGSVRASASSSYPGLARSGSPPSPLGAKRSTSSYMGGGAAAAPPRSSASAGCLGRSGAASVDVPHTSERIAAMSRASSSGDCRKDRLDPQDPKRAAAAAAAAAAEQQQESLGLFHIIQQLAAAENALWNILDGLKSHTTHSSFFCREYWGTSASQAQLSLERLLCNERLKRQVQQACVLESLSLAVASHLCSGLMQNISVTIRSRLRNLLYYVHENCLVLLDMVCQRWLLENQNYWQESSKTGHCPENLNLDILVKVKRYRRLRRGEHVMALRQHNEMIVNVVRQLCRGAAPKRPPLSSRGAVGAMRSPGVRDGPGAAAASQQPSPLTVVNEILTARTPLDRLRASTIRSKLLQYLCFRPLLNVDGADPDSPWPVDDPYPRYGAEFFAQDGMTIWFEPLPPMLPDLEISPTLPAVLAPDTYTLVLDLDETLVHYSEVDGQGSYDIRPGMHEFLERTNQLGYELVIFTAATQDYADWVIDQIDPQRLIRYRLYRQHALPWGPIFVKDLSRLGRNLERTLIIDNVQENFMLQPHNGIFIATWYDDPNDTALSALTHLLDELINTRARVPVILDKYRDQIPAWAGFDTYSQGVGDYSSDFDLAQEDHHMDQLDHEQVPPNAAYGGGGYQDPHARLPQQGNGIGGGGGGGAAPMVQPPFQPQARTQPAAELQQHLPPQHEHVRTPVAGSSAASTRPSSYIPASSTSPADLGGRQAASAASSPAGAYHQAQPLSPYHSAMAQAQPQAQAASARAAAHHQHHQHQPPPVHHSVQAHATARPAVGMTAPFSSSGVSGPFQAPPPTATHPAQHAPPSHLASWKGGGFGPLQAPPMQQRRR
eukprot:TRINITY_DN41879_c0_g1_i2.p1 TRINITY_DN41879_c0_g1~~TRINITY_DN41879_c0_g1_i2.p1  ORF type:complete len:856 (-),score=158.25 TRINITY_DN41879_c0_g1_i2:188-2755(-)